jgi:transcriptional regulator with XRE-family HTH domain
MTDPRSFGAWLRRERERRTITLRAIADRTKVGVGLLEGLERGDLSRWPGGIYRRAFVRAYAEAIGLDAELVLANFARVFEPDQSGPAVTTPEAPIHGQPEEMRLALVAAPAPGVSPAAVRRAGRDVACIAVIALFASVFAGWIGFWSAAAVAALSFHLFGVLELASKAPWLNRNEANHTSDAPRAEVVSFSEEQARATSRRSAAARLIADLSTGRSASVSGRRRTARS